jgi:hypothetical protein
MVSGEWLEKRVTRTPDTLSAWNKTFPYAILSTILASGVLCSEEFLWPPRCDARWRFIRALLPLSMAKPQGGSEKVPCLSEAP